MVCRTRVLVVLALLSTCAALASARPNLLPGDPRLTDPNHQHHHGGHHHGDHGDHAHGDHGEHAHDDHHGDHGDHGHDDHGEHAHGDHGDHAHDGNGDHTHGNHGDHGHGDHGNHVEQNPTVVADGSGENANVITDLNDDAVSGEPLPPPELQTELDAAFLAEVGPSEEAVSVTGELAIQFSGEESSSVILDDDETQDEPELSVQEDPTQIQEDVGQGEASGSSASAGIPDISYRQTQAPQETGVPDISYGQNEIDYGAGIQITPAKPGQVGHHNPFNPDYQPPPGLQPVPSSPPTQQVVQQPTSQGAGPGQPANQATSVVKPINQGAVKPDNQGAVKPDNQGSSAAQPVSQGGIQSPSQGNVQPSNQGNTQPPNYQNYKPTSQIQLGGQLIDVSPQILHPSVFNPTPPPTKRPPTARPTVRPVTQAPNKPVSRPSNPFLAGQVSLPSSFQHSPKPVPQPPVTPAPILEVNTHPLGGPAGPKGPIQTVCPSSASALPCVPDALCDPFTGFLKTDAVKLPYPISKETPTVAVLQCLLPAGGIGICCKKLPRPKPRPTSTALPLGTDYGHGLELVTPRPGNQKPVNVFLPNYKPIPIGTPVSRYVRQ